MEHPEDANEIFLKRAPKLDPELTLRRQRAYNAVTSSSAQYPSGYMDNEMFRSTYDRLVEENVIVNPFDVNDAFTTRFLEKIQAEPGTSQ